MITQEQIWAKALLSRAERHVGIEVNGIHLAAGDRDRALFSQGLVLLREAEDLLPDAESKAAFRASPQTITDINGTPHTMTVDAMRALLVAYGSAYQALWVAAQTQ